MGSEKSVNPNIHTQHVFIIGAKSLGAYGGYETFVDKLTEYHQNDNSIKYHVACKANGDGIMDESKLVGAVRISYKEFMYHNARCFKIHVPDIGAAQALYYDIAALHECCGYIKKHNIQNAIIYILACRIGPVMPYYFKKIHKLGGKTFINPDGHEWMRSKWSRAVRRYWKISEGLMVRYSDLAICDSINIEKYIHEKYDGKGIKGSDPKTTYIAYGAEIRKSALTDNDSKLNGWYEKNRITSGNYYLIVGRFVPENNYETIIKEFMRSETKRDLVIITNMNKKFMSELECKLHFKDDSRIKFVGTVYDKELLMKIRENAYAYLHGHEVGGTNPSLLEALGATKLNLLLDVGFNREVAGDSALYWNKDSGNLSKLIAYAEALKPEGITELDFKAKARIKSNYSWQFIADKYKKIFNR